MSQKKRLNLFPQIKNIKAKTKKIYAGIVI